MSETLVIAIELPVLCLAIMLFVKGAEWNIKQHIDKHMREKSKP